MPPPDIEQTQRWPTAKVRVANAPLELPVGDVPFARPPEVAIMSPDQVASMVDATKLLVDQQDVTPLSLAHQAIELQSEEDPLDAALRRVLRAMKV